MHLRAPSLQATPPVLLHAPHSRSSPFDSLRPPSYSPTRLYLYVPFGDCRDFLYCIAALVSASASCLVLALLPSIRLPVHLPFTCDTIHLVYLPVHLSPPSPAATDLTHPPTYTIGHQDQPHTHTTPHKMHPHPACDP
ncbi:hypothetical protein B0H12DRAFT_684239 [Mycena haematopus]|nr:hypothetical protein B0H12DRAFT_684239 [Mycena haematopus]